MPAQLLGVILFEPAVCILILNSQKNIGVLGATSLVGQLVLPQLVAAGYSVTAFSRSANSRQDAGINWQHIGSKLPITGSLSGAERNIPLWMSNLPIWALSKHFDLLESYGVKRIIVLSSTSRFTKENSSQAGDREIARLLVQGELTLQKWAVANDVEWVILRPTLIYGLGRDKNIAEMARLIGRFGFFPILGEARGLRQPIHAKDVMAACLAALNNPEASGHAYNICGAETLPYREMVKRVFAAMGRPVRLLPVPMWLFRLGVQVIRVVPRYRQWNVAMAERMNQDLVFDHSDATRDISFKPHLFDLSLEDVTPR